MKKNGVGLGHAAWLGKDRGMKLDADAKESGDLDMQLGLDKRARWT